MQKSTAKSTLSGYWIIIYTWKDKDTVPTMGEWCLLSRGGAPAEASIGSRDSADEHLQKPAAMWDGPVGGERGMCSPHASLTSHLWFSLKSVGVLLRLQWG